MSFIWPDKNEEQLKIIKEQLRQIGSRLNEIDVTHSTLYKSLDAQNDKIDNWINNVDALKTSLNAQGAKISLLSNSGSVKELNDITASIERLLLWKADIMNMLTEKNPATNRPRLTKMGKKLSAFYGEK